MSTEQLKMIRKHLLCDDFGVTADGLDKIIQRDPTFPRPIKMGSSRQAGVYFRISEVNAWLEQQKVEVKP